MTPSNTQQSESQQVDNFNLSTPPKKGINIDCLLATPEPVKIK